MPTSVIFVGVRGKDEALLTKRSLAGSSIHSSVRYLLQPVTDWFCDLVSPQFLHFAAGPAPINKLSWTTYTCKTVFRGHSYPCVEKKCISIYFTDSSLWSNTQGFPTRDLKTLRLFGAPGVAMFLQIGGISAMLRTEIGVPAGVPAARKRQGWQAVETAATWRQPFVVSVIFLGNHCVSIYLCKYYPGRNILLGVLTISLRRLLWKISCVFEVPIIAWCVHASVSSHLLELCESHMSHLEPELQPSVFQTSIKSICWSANKTSHRISPCFVLGSACSL